MILPGGTERVKGTFVDETNSLYDPTAIEIKIYDSLGALQSTVTEASCVRESLGVWHYDYSSASSAEIGRWSVSWKNTVGTKSWVYPFQFIVWDLTWPTVATVRSYLAGLGTIRLADSVIEGHICNSAGYVVYNSGEDAPLQNLYQAILIRSVWQSYLAYAAEYERTAGKLPEAVDRQIRRYEIQSRDAMIGVQSGAVSGVVTISDLRTNTIEDNS